MKKGAIELWQMRGEEKKEDGVKADPAFQKGIEFEEMFCSIRFPSQPPAPQSQTTHEDGEHGTD